MATKPLDGQMKALKSATDSVRRMGLYDINTPQSVREGTPLRLFSPDRARSVSYTNLTMNTILLV